MNEITKLRRFLLVVVCLVAFLLRSWGIEWPRIHPDEYKIASWVEYRKDHAHIEDRFYAEGFFVLIKPVYAVHRWIAEESFQWKCFLRAGDKLPVVESRALLFARWFNVWLAVANVAVLYLLVVTVTGSWGAGLFAALCLALSHLHVEHSHYAESDIAAMLMLTLALWLWAGVIRKEGRFRFWLAAVATGFAVGTKFTLSPLLVLAIVMAWRDSLAEGKIRAWKGVRGTLLVLFLCVVGLVLANPGMLDWKWFYPRMQGALSSVYGERSGLMGGVTDKWMPALVHLKEFRVNGLDLGWPWIALIAIGLPISLMKPYRSFWPVLFVFPVMFFVYFLFFAPWVRDQEFMLFTPSVALWSAVGIAGLASVVFKTARPVFRYAICSFLIVLVLADVAVKGLKRDSLLAWPDPRVMAQKWIGVHAPADSVIACSPYTDPVFRQKQGRFIEAENVERQSISDVRAQGASYIVRNPSLHGRGTMNPLTNTRFPQYDQYWNEFVNKSQLLWRWTTFEPASFHFCCAPIELRGLIHGSPVVSGDVLFFQPGLMTDFRDESVWTLQGSLGSAKIIEVTKKSRNLVLGGPAAHDRPVYVLLQTAERGAVVRVKGLGQSRRVELSPYSAEVMILKRSWYQPRCSSYDVINIRAEPEKYILGIPCYAEILVDESAVMSRLIQKGYPDKALDFLKSISYSTLTDKMVLPAFVAATAEGDWPLAGQLYQRAGNLLEKLRTAATNSSDKVEFCGINGVYYNDFSRIRLDPVYRSLISDRPVSSGQINITQNLILPVRLAKGAYQLSFVAQMTVSDPLQAGGLPVRIDAAGAKSQEAVEKDAGSGLSRHSLLTKADDPAYKNVIIGQNIVGRVTSRGVLGGFSTTTQDVSLGSDHGKPVILSLHVEKETDLCLSFIAPCAGRIDLSKIELRWNLCDMIRSADLELCRALSRYDFHSLPPEGSLARISERSVSYPDDLELLRLKSEAMKLNGGSNTAERATVISRIKETAPDYVPDDVAHDEAPVNQVFSPFFRLSGIKHDVAAKTLRCRFEVLCDEAPTPVVALSKKRLWSTRWRKIAECKLNDRSVLFQGEQFIVDIPLPEGANPPFNGFALSLRSNVPWVPYDYAVTGQKDTKVLLRQWFPKP